MTDIEIAQAANPLKIGEIAQAAGVDEKYLEQYGNYKAKVDYNLLKETEGKDGKLILVTAINPTPAGEGKTTTTVGLADGLKRLGKKVTVALREPSLGPVFGVKGGAAGGGYAQVIPMEDINLHLPVISTRSAQQTTCWQRCWTIISIRAMHSASIRSALPGSVLSI